MIVTIFRSRLQPEAQDEYMKMAARMSELAKSMPGYISHKIFVAQDEEQVTVVEFDTEEHMQAWARHPEHIEAQKLGRTKFYSEYRIQICNVERERTFPRPVVVER